MMSRVFVLLLHHLLHSLVALNLLLHLLLLLFSDNGVHCKEAVSASDSPVSVKGVLGSRAKLPCFVDLQKCGDIHFLTWIKSDQAKPDATTWIRIYLYSDSVRKPLQDFMNRASFTLKGDSGAQLEIDNLKYTDEAFYKCDVTYINGTCPSLTTVHLEIIAPPSPAMVIYDGNPIGNGSKVGPLNEGDDLKLKCAVSGGKPLPELVWHQIKRGGKVEKIEGNQVVHDQNVTSIELRKVLSRSDLNAHYECHVVHEAIGSESAKDFDSRVELDLNVRALSMKIEGPDWELKESDIVQLECIATRSRPQVYFKWLNGSQAMNVKERFEIDGEPDGTVTSRSTIEFAVTRFDHEIKIECQAENPAMREPLVRSIQLLVRYTPRVVMQPMSGLRKIEDEDTTAVIFCTYQANPMSLLPNETKWYKDGLLLDTSSSSNHYMEVGDSADGDFPKLIIYNLTREDSGDYTCRISNAMGAGKPTEPLRLNVLYAPSVVLQIYPDSLIKEGGEVRLFCDVISGNPFNVTKVRWLRSSSHDHGNDVLINETSGNEIIWLPVDRTLSGNYSCMAQNAAGWSNKSNPVELDVNYLPGKAEISQINGVNPIRGKDLVLECFVDELGKPIATEYLWEQNGVPLDNQKESRLLIQNVSLSTRGNYSCAASSPVGVGPRGHLQVEPIASPRLIESLPRVDGALFNAPNHSVSCRIECLPLCNISWFRNGIQINPEGPHEGYTIEEVILPEEPELERFVSIHSTLTWNMTYLSPLDRIDDNANYSCVSSGNYAGPSVESHMQFFVEYPPENVTITPNKVDILENEIPLPLSCESNALPPARYEWYYNGKRLGQTGSLHFNRHISRNRGGKYVCVAINDHGTAEAEVLVNVLYKPNCDLRQNGTLEPESKQTMLICESDANPNENLTFTWRFNNETYQINKYTESNNTDGLFVVDGKYGIVILPTDRNELYNVRWECSITNSVGTTNRSCILLTRNPRAFGTTGLTGDPDFILLISAIVVAVIVVFVIVLLCLICCMRRRRRQKNDGSRKSLEGPPARGTPTKDGETPKLGKEMYENMAFHRKQESMLFPLHLKPKLLPQYENIAQLTNELRRTQSARLYHKELCVLKNGVLERNIVYADLQLRNERRLNHQNHNHHLNHNRITPNKYHHPNHNCNINCITPNNDDGSSCEYAVLRFDRTPSPPSVC